MKRILFVDDEPKLLEGLQRLLRPLRKEWDMTFALGAEEALAVLARIQIDVIVTDMRMPGMDGAELLQRVHQQHPQVIRIVLSGQFDEQASMRAAPVAHQFLIKPCDPEKLKAAIETGQTSAYRPDQATQRVISAIGALPSPPKTCTQLLEALNNPETSIGTVSDIIDADVALTAKLLQLANSAFFSVQHNVTDAKSAVTALGLDVVKQLVVSAAIMHEFQPATRIKAFSIEQFELHSRLTARMAALLPVQPGVASLRVTASLLHDAGKLVLAAYLPSRFERVCVGAAERGWPLQQAEQHYLQTTHAEIGAYLLNLWGLPRSVVDAIAAHHYPLAAAGPPTTGDASQGLDLLSVVHIANALAHDTGPPDEPPAALDMDFIDQLGVAERLPAWRAAGQVARRAA